MKRIVGYGRALELLATARVVDAQEALALGLVDRVIPIGKALEAAQELAGWIAVNSQAAVQAAKRILRLGLDDLGSENASIERREFIEIWDTEERRAVFSRYREKDK